MKNYLNKIVLVSVGILVVSIFLIPFFVFAGEAPGGIVPCKGWFACGFCEFSQMMDRLMRFALFSLALPVGVVAIIIAGVFFVTAGGNPQKIEMGKKTLTYAVMGLLIAFGAWLIVDATLGALIDDSYRPWHEFPGCGG